MTTGKQNSFGVFFGKVRKRNKLTLREFCRRAGADPANVSRMERGLIPPPKGREILERYGGALGLTEGSEDWYTLFDLAAVTQGSIPADIMEDRELVKALPMFFRTLRGERPTPEEMRRIADRIREDGK